MVKKANRKKQRKQHKHITRNDVLEYHITHLEALREAEELWVQEQEEFYLEFLYEKDLEDSLEAFEYDPWEHEYYNPMDYDDDYYGDAYNDYMDRYEDPSYSAGSLTRKGLTRLDMNARITEQDVGESLGDILARALRSEHDKVG